MPPCLPFWCPYASFSLELSFLENPFLFGRSLQDVSSHILFFPPESLNFILFSVVSLAGVILIARPTFLFGPSADIPHFWIDMDPRDSVVPTDRIISVGYTLPLYKHRSSLISYPRVSLVGVLGATTACTCST